MLHVVGLTGAFVPSRLTGAIAIARIRPAPGPQLQPAADAPPPRIRWSAPFPLGRTTGIQRKGTATWTTASARADSGARARGTAHQVLERFISQVIPHPSRGIGDRPGKSPDEARKQATTLITGCRWDEALGLMDMLRKNNIPPNVFNYGALMGRAKSEFDRERASAKVLEVYDDMLRHDVAPNVRVCTTVITALGRQGRADEAEQVFRAMEKRGDRADIEAFSALMSAHAAKGGVQGADAVQRLYQELMLRPEAADEHRLGTWLLAVAKAGREHPRMRTP